MAVLTWEYTRSWKADAAKKLLQEQKEEQQRQNAMEERKVDLLYHLFTLATSNFIV